MAQNDDLTDLMAGTVAADGTPAARTMHPAAAEGQPADGTVRVADAREEGAAADGEPAAADGEPAAAEKENQPATAEGETSAAEDQHAAAEGESDDLISRAYAYDDLTDLIARAAEANEALLNGDAGRYVELLPHTDDYTLMPPFGGEPIRGHDDSPEARASTAKFFQGGTATFDVVESYTSGDLAVLVVVERQTVRVGDLAEQDWSLRVTLVFRRQDGRWCLAHRHADVLLPGISIERAAAIARGEE